MSRTFNATEPKVRIKPSKRPGTFNKYANLPPVIELAKWVCRLKGLRNPVCGYVSKRGHTLGYGRENPDEDSRMAKSLRLTQQAIPATASPIAGINAAIEYSNRIADKFESEIRAGVDESDLKGKFTAAISEAIVQCLFDKSRRSQEGMIMDAVVFEGKRQITKRNIDFFYCPKDSPLRAEVYECKNNPSSVFYEAMALAAFPGRANDEQWKRSKLYLMERLKHLLEAKDIPTHLGLISLHKDVAVRAMRRILEKQAGVPAPNIAAVYAREDMFNYIPTGRLKCVL